MTGYYAERLSAERLGKCYEIAPPRVRQYLDAELNHVLLKIGSGDAVLELGCGYGRVMEGLWAKAGAVVGIDSSYSSVQLGRELLADKRNCQFVCMDAAALAFGDQVFDAVLCVQNGLSAFKVNQRVLISESIRVTRSGGRVLLSSYSMRFWEDRVEWFQLQAEHGLLGEIDRTATGDGVIVCKDGFKATTIRPEKFHALMSGFDVPYRVEEVDASSVFCEIML